MLAISFKNYENLNRITATEARRGIVVLLLIALLFGVVGCGWAPPVRGLVYANAKGPLMLPAMTDVKAMKQGEATATSYLGLFGMGDASIQAAAKAGGISKIHHVDYRSSNFLFLVTSVSVIVYGE